MQINFDNAWLDFALQMTTESGAILTEAAAIRPDVEIKPDRSFVTALDARIERRLREMIADRFPSHGILGEEEDPTNLDAELVWVLDPIDGTAAFIAGLPVYGTLIALMHEGEPVLGIIDHPMTGERWVGVKGRATTYNGSACHTRHCGSLGEAIVSASNADLFRSDRERQALDAVREATAWRIWGGACMSFGRLASGRTDVAFDTGLKLWDYAPMRPIIEGAGGVITDWDGKPVTHKTGSQILAAGNRDRHSDMLRLLEATMNH